MKTLDELFNELTTSESDALSALEGRAMNLHKGKQSTLLVKLSAATDWPPAMQTKQFLQELLCYCCEMRCRCRV